MGQDPEKPNRKIVAAFSDTHGGHKLGLMNPKVVLFDETADGEVVPYTPTPTAMQRYLWEQYVQDVNKVIEIAAGDPIVAIHCGDICHGKKYPSQLVGTRLADQVFIACANFFPWVCIENVTAIRIVHGTSAHNFGEASAALLVAAQLQSTYKGRGKDIGTLSHGIANIDGVIFDYAHHGPGTGIRNWLRGNVARHYCRSLMLDEIVEGRRPPDVVLRGHFHSYIRETVRINFHYETEMFVLPAYCGLSEHGQQATRSKYVISNGMVIFELIDGKVNRIYPEVRTVDLRTEERL